MTWLKGKGLKGLEDIPGCLVRAEEASSLKLAVAVPDEKENHSLECLMMM